MKKMFVVVILLWAGLVFAQDLFFIERGDTIFLTAQKGARGTDGSVQNQDDWFTTQHGARVKIADGVVVGLVADAQAETVFGQYKIKSFERLSDNIFLVSPVEKSEQFELSRELSQNSAVKYAHPNLIRERRSR